MKRLLLGIATVAVLTAVAASGQDIILKKGIDVDGSSVVPGPGDLDGTGTAELGVHHGHGQICFRITVRNIEAAVAAHIHRGDPGVAGPAVANLSPAPTLGSSSGCVSSAGRDVTHAILTDPDAFYVDIHNAPFPDGALRGQLTRGRD